MNRFLICFSLVSLLFFSTVKPANSEVVRNCRDTAELTKQNVVFALDGGDFVRVDVLGERLFRIRHSKTQKWTESGLNRYGVFVKQFPKITFQQTEDNGDYSLTTKQAKLSISRKDGTIVLSSHNGKIFTKQTAPVFETNGGYDVRFTLTKGERIYGLGDVSRENIMRRGGVYECWVRNVKSYIPIPVMLSNRGWGLLMNTTWRNSFDVGKKDPDRVICTAARSDLDYYLFCGSDYRSLLDVYTSFTGRPALLPIWGYAFTYVCNQNIDAFNLVNEALTFRRESMPCDVMGLEPGWMSRMYDFSTEKKWHPGRFIFPYWAPKGTHTFPAALRRRGFKLSLWLCCNYDLAVYEERLLDGLKPAVKSDRKAVAKSGDPDTFLDEHLTNPGDKKKKKVIKKRGVAEKTPPKEPEPWFEHLKKFVDQGAAAFKLDGANQVIEHPKRKWGNGMTDEEMHNLYPVIYAKQMARGYEKHTRRRAMVYSAGGGAGAQQYVATWAGDTGGGVKPLASMLNLAFSGHSNHSCDMKVSTTEGIHFGFLQTWAQQNNWDYWHQPWLQKDAQITAFRAYGKLRYKLLPYLYSTAAEAALTGYPVMRAMSMVYPNDPTWDTCMKQYMLGDFLLVSAFTKTVRLPEGVWIDFWSGKRKTGPATVPVTLGPTQGGALFVKSGAIIPVWPPCNHVEKGWSSEVGLLVYPAKHSTFTLHEDDGESLDYRKGKYAQTRLTCETIGQTVKLTVGGRKGSYNGMPKTRNFTVTIHLPSNPKTVTLDGKVVTNYQWDNASATATISIPACGNKPRVLECK